MEIKTSDPVAWQWNNHGWHTTQDRQFAEWLEADGVLLFPLYRGAPCSKGWKIVPTKPTPEMLRAFIETEKPSAGFVDSWLPAYKAMIEAAPAVPDELEG